MYTNYLQHRTAPNCLRLSFVRICRKVTNFFSFLLDDKIDEQAVEMDFIRRCLQITREHRVSNEDGRVTRLTAQNLIGNNNAGILGGSQPGTTALGEAVRRQRLE